MPLYARTILLATMATLVALATYFALTWISETLAPTVNSWGIN